MTFKDRVVLVTGAASGMGRALCLRMGREGAAVGLIDRNAEGLDALRAELKAAGVRTAAAVADVRHRDEVRAAVGLVVAELGEVDIVIPCAGLAGISTADDLKVDEVEKILQINFLGVVYTLDAVLPAMLARGSGHVVGMASLSAFRAIPFESAYCASKAALVFYLESLRPSLRRRGVLVTTIFPGFVQTPLLAGLIATSGSKPPSGIISVDYAVERIVRAVRRGARVACFPWTTTWLARISSRLPYFIYDRVMTRIASHVPLRY